MKTVNALKKLEKIVDNGIIDHPLNGYWGTITGEKGTQVIGFYSQKDIDGVEEIVCIHTKKEGMESDSQTDYFVEVFHDNLTQAIKWACRKAGKEL